MFQLLFARFLHLFVLPLLMTLTFLLSFVLRQMALPSKSGKAPSKNDHFNLFYSITYSWFIFDVLWTTFEASETGEVGSETNRGEA